MTTTDFGTVMAPRSQRGVASLIVVLVLFFIVSLVAAYTSRNLIFEQRTSANQYRATQAIEAAEAGVEWATSLLNHGRITAACTTSTVNTDTSFRDRYLNVDANGLLTARRTSTNADLTPTCVSNGSTWDCDCPADAAPSLATPSGPGVFPAFRVRFVTPASIANQPGIVRIEVVACTRIDDACLDFSGTADGSTNEGRAYVSTLLAMAGGVAAVPRGALTALGDVTLSGGAVYGADVPIHAGGVPTIDPSFVTRAAAGSYGNPAPVQDSALADFATSPDRMFAAVFSMWSPTFQGQPAAVVLDCDSVTCNAAAVRSLIDLNPGRPIWVDGDLAIDSAGDVGSATAPVLLVVSGDLDVSVAGVTIHGLIYVQDASWANTGPVQVGGALVVEGDVVTGAPVIRYDAGTLNRLRHTTGSFVRVPGSWRDFTQ